MPVAGARCPSSPSAQNNVPGRVPHRRMADVDHMHGQVSETPFVPNVRAATSQDATFLQEMLTIAANWRPGSPVRPVAEVIREPVLAHYVIGWPRHGDFGFVAEMDHPVGAAWCRLFPAHDPGYGFVDEATPEVSIGVSAEARGRGIGTSLLTALVREAGRRGLTALSLSVEPDNPAIRLYERLGFQIVDQLAGAVTMTLSVG
jgi:GNAT superfamily N-acetyltransferase